MWGQSSYNGSNLTAAVGTSLVCGNKSRICSHKMRFSQAHKESEGGSAKSRELRLGWHTTQAGRECTSAQRLKEYRRVGLLVLCLFFLGWISAQPITQDLWKPVLLNTGSTSVGDWLSPSVLSHDASHGIMSLSSCFTQRQPRENPKHQLHVWQWYWWGNFSLLNVIKQVNLLFLITYLVLVINYCLWKHFF